MQAELKRTHSCGDLRREHAGSEVILNGWVDTLRDHGGVIFANLRDRSGLVQVVFRKAEVRQAAEGLRLEYCLAVKGTVVKRPEGTRNPAMPSGEVEVSATELVILNPSAVPPFDISGTRREEDPGEDIRLRFRYLDLRRVQTQKNLIIRHRVSQLTRRYLDEQGFLEVETPFLTKSTPEGARDFLVPCRLSSGEFYALPQSPQLFKQLLMVSGLEKYFQIVRCFRDEDLRADRQPEFTQVDIEMSFVVEKDIRRLIDGLFSVIFKEIRDVEVPSPIPVMSYEEALRRFGTDRPDLRYAVELADLSELAEETEASFLRTSGAAGAVVGLAVPEKGALKRSRIEELGTACKEAGATGVLWLRRKGDGFTGPGAKLFPGEHGNRLAEQVGARDEDLVMIVAANATAKAQVAGGQLRVALAKELKLAPEDAFAFTWGNEFPLFERDEEEDRWTAVHHPFTSPREEDLPYLEENPGRVRAQAYDIVVNGVELGGGSIRIHRQDVQQAAFRAIKIGAEEASAKFGFLLEALKYGAPPHGGIALGLDRFIAVLAGATSIREVIPFPKTQRGTCALTGAPSSVDDDQLAELGLMHRPRLKR